jgi:hypothetical protein
MHWARHHQSHPSDAPTIEAPDYDRAIFLNAFVGVASPLTAFGVTHALFELPVPPERPANRVAETVRSHDPPSVCSLASRAPPAFLS